MFVCVHVYVLVCECVHLCICVYTFACEWMFPFVAMSATCAVPAYDCGSKGVILGTRPRVDATRNACVDGIIRLNGKTKSHSSTATQHDSSHFSATQKPLKGPRPCRPAPTTMLSARTDQHVVPVWAIECACCSNTRWQYKKKWW